VFFFGYRHGLLGQHQRYAVLDPVQPVQPGVVEQLVVGEVQQTALVDGTHQDVEQRVL
jgi:hypothetical protein